MAESGRLQLLASEADLGRLDVDRLERRAPIERNASLPAEIVAMVLDRVARH